MMHHHAKQKDSLTNLFALVRGWQRLTVRVTNIKIHILNKNG